MPGSELMLGISTIAFSQMARALIRTSALQVTDHMHYDTVCHVKKLLIYMY